MRYYLLITFIALLQYINFAQTYNLENCINQALQNNLNVEAAKLNTEQLQQNLKASQAVFLPSVNLFANHTFANGGVINSQSGLVENETYNFSDAGIGVDFNLFNGMREAAKKKSDEALYNAGVKKMESVRNQVAVQISMAYLNVLYSMSVKQNIEEQINITKKQIQRAEALINVGSVTRSELLRLQSTLSEEQLQLTQIENDINMYKIDLVQIINLPDSLIASFQIEAVNSVSVSDSSIITIDSAYKKSIEIMPEIAMAKSEILSNQHLVSVAKSEYYPKLNLSAGYGADYTSLRTDSYSQQFSDYATAKLGLHLTVPIFNKGLTKIAVAKSRISVLESENNYYRQCQELYKDIQLAYNEVISSRDNYLKYKELLSFRTENMRLAENQYQSGAISSIEFNIEKAQYLKAMNNLEQSKYGYIFKKVLYNFYSTGEVHL